MDELSRIDRSKWQKSSYLGHYDENATHYEGIRTLCRKCEVSFIFSGSEQKYAFEQEHRYPGWLPGLCKQCALEWQTLDQEIIKIQNLWEKERLVYATNLEFLERWLNLLNIAKLYRKKNFNSRITMLKNAIENLQQNQKNA